MGHGVIGSGYGEDLAKAAKAEDSRATLNQASPPPSLMTLANVCAMMDDLHQRLHMLEETVSSVHSMIGAEHYPSMSAEKFEDPNGPVDYMAHRTVAAMQRVAYIGSLAQAIKARVG